MDIKLPVTYQQSHIHDFIDRLFRILESDHETPLDILHITMTLFHKYLAISQKKDQSIYEFGSACFGLCDLLIINDDHIDYELIFHLKIHNQDPEKNKKKKIFTNILQTRINDVLIATNFDIINNNAYLMYQQFNKPFENDYLNKMIEYIIGCSLYDSELVNMDLIIFVHSVVYLAYLWADNIVKYNSNITYLDNENYSQNYRDDITTYLNEITICVDKLIFIIKYVNETNRTINMIHKYGLITVNIDFLPATNFKRHLTIFPSRYIINNQYLETYDYDIKEKIGKGNYGDVYLGNTSLFKKENVAIKKQLYDVFALSEINILNHLKHPNIVSIMHVFFDQDEKSIMFTMEYYDYDLAKMIKSNLLTDNMVKIYSEQLIRAISHCHSCGIIHQDIKPQNIMISLDRTQIKLIDFGISRAYSFNTVNFDRAICSLPYRPPEILLGQQTYSNKIDMWSIGCVIVEMYTKHVLFNIKNDNMSEQIKEEKMLEQIKEEKMLEKIFSYIGTPTHMSWPDVMRLPKWKQFSDHKKSQIVDLDDTNMKNLINNLLIAYPNDRISANAALEYF